VKRWTEIIEKERKVNFSFEMPHLFFRHFLYKLKYHINFRYTVATVSSITTKDTPTAAAKELKYTYEKKADLGIRIGPKKP
jgi:hypothetical protein